MKLLNIALDLSLRTVFGILLRTVFLILDFTPVGTLIRIFEPVLITFLTLS